jgi:hypothetical protein
MRNPIDIDRKDNQAIREEIGERLRAYLRVEPKLPANLGIQVNLLRGLEGQSPSIVPDVEHGWESQPSKDASRGDQWRFIWLRRRRA